jgi:2-iminobutanoate/2-iminopropanoate deaminase
MTFCRREAMSEPTIIETNDAPEAIGPYSQATVHDGFVFTAGQIPIDPRSGELVTGDVASQTERVLQNLFAVLAAAGSSPRGVLKTTVFLRDMSDFAEMNRVYERFFEGHRPARSTVQAARLPRDCGVEIECIAAVLR